MTRKSRIIIGLMLIAGISIISFLNIKDKAIIVNSVEPVNEVVNKEKPSALHLGQLDKSVKNPTLSQESQIPLNTDIDNSDSTKIATFSISGMAAPNNLPEDLLNTPLTMLDINYESLNKLKTGDKISIPLFSGQSLSLVINKNTANKDFSVIKGVFEADDIKLPVSLSYREGSVFGSIATSDGEYRISKMSGVHVIYKIPDLKGQPDNDAMIFTPTGPH